MRRKEGAEAAKPITGVGGEIQGRRGGGRRHCGGRASSEGEFQRR